MTTLKELKTIAHAVADAVQSLIGRVEAAERKAQWWKEDSQNAKGVLSGYIESEGKRTKHIKELEAADKDAKHDIENLYEAVNYELNRADKAEGAIIAWLKRNAPKCPMDFHHWHSSEGYDSPKADKPKQSHVQKHGSG